MNKIIITDSAQFEEVIQSFEQSLTKIKDIFLSESKNIEEINATSTWTGKTQEVIYAKHKLLEKNFQPIEDSLQLYINFMRKTLDDYKKFEEEINRNAEASSENLTVNS